MKKNVTLFGLAVLLTAIVFSFAACKHDSEEPDPTKLRVSNEPVTFANPTTETNFAYYDADDPLSNYITGTPKVQIADGNKLTLELDKPSELALFPSGITATPSDAKFFYIGGFVDSHNVSYLFMKGPGAGGMDRTYLIYVDRDVTVNGTASSGGTTYIYTNVTLKRGWNYVPSTYASSTRTFTSATQEKPAGAIWTVDEA